MKKLLSLILVLSLLLSLGITASAAATTTDASITYRGIKLVLNGQEIIPCDAAGNTTEPFIMGGTTYLPLRAVAQALGLGVKWIPETSTVQLTSGGEVKTGTVPSATSATKTVKITYRDIKVVLNGVQLKLKNANGDTVEPFIMDGTTYLPLRIIGEALNLNVGWDAATSTVSLKEKTVTKYQPILITAAYNHDGQDFTSETVFGYSSTGQLLSLDFTEFSGGKMTASYAYTLQYNSAGTVTYMSEEDLTQGSANVDIYDDDGELIQRVYSYGDETVIWEYNVVKGDNGKPATVECYTTIDGSTVLEYITTLSYDANGRLVKEETAYVDGVGEDYTVTYTHDAAGRILSQTTKSTDWDHSLEWEYDDAGRMLKYKFTSRFGEYTDEGWSYTFTYNDKGQMVSSDYSAPGFGSNTTTWEYDAKGNCVASKNGDSSFVWTYDANGCPISHGRVSTGFTYSAEAIYAGFEGYVPNVLAEDLLYAYSLEP